MTDDLRQHLDDALSAITPAPAPLDGAMHTGTRRRWRRRVVVAGSIAAAAAAAVLVPLNAHWQASPAPANSHYTVTVYPPGPHTPANEIAYGTVNGKSWRILMSKTIGVINGQSGDCTIWSGPAFGEAPGYLPSNEGCQPPSGATPADPVVYGLGMGGFIGEIAQGYSAAVAPDVSYVTVTLTNGTVLTLHPATVYGSRYIAFALPSAFGTVTRVTAYSRRGEIASTVPENDSVPSVFVGAVWLRPGQHGLPRATGVIFSRTINGKTWTETAYLGPWGICTGGFDGYSSCFPISAPRGLGVLDSGISGSAKYTLLAVWTVPPSAVRVMVVAARGEKAFEVRPVTVGVQKFVAFLVPGGLWAPTVTAYNSAGQVIGSK